MAGFFERMSVAMRANEGGYSAPDFLQTHPVTTTRISEAKARAEQMLAGAIAAEAAMEAFGVETMRVCPWALREGLILKRIEHLAEGTGTPVNPKTLLGE